ncbi:MAG: hypothetical protein NC908_05305 [Candidatus Omnitrophica bacterium]|nr:hypothetical protein [Candidatus Omnitrophota bacterium]
MKTEVKKLDSTKRELSVEVEGDIVKNKFEDIYQRISREAKVRGFRPGHIPRDILEKNFSPEANQIVIKELIRDVYSQAIKKEGLNAVSVPDIYDIKLDKTTLSFKANIEVIPAVNLKNYKGIKVHFKRIEISDEEVRRYIDSLKETRKVDSVDDNLARSLGYPDVGELDRAIRAQLFLQKVDLQQQKIENEIMDALRKDLKIPLPQSLVNRQLEDMLRRAKLNLALKGLPPEKIEEQEKTLSEELKPQAERQVEIYIILSEIAKRENIPLDEHTSGRVMELLLSQADWQIES